VELGRDEEALKYLEPALASSPNDPALIYALGLASLRLRRPMVNGAIKALAEAPGGLPASRLLQGQANLTNFQFEKAVEDLEAARKLNPELPRLHYSLGLAYFKTDRFDDARAAFEAELTRTPKDVSSLCYLASMDEKEAKLESARQRLDVALSVDPTSPDANWLLGKVLIAQGRPAQAVRPLQIAVSSDPLDPQKRYQLARAYQQIGRREDAERELAEMKRIQALEFEKDQSKVIKP
jgi:tetratricopeptide (TPR) repeat protein